MPDFSSPEERSASLPSHIIEKSLIASKASLEALVAAQSEVFTKDDVRRLKDIARLRHLEHDHDLKLMALDVSVEKFTRPEQSLAAAALATTHREIVRLQAKLDLPRMPRHPSVTKAETLRVAYYRAHAIR